MLQAGNSSFCQSTSLIHISFLVFPCSFSCSFPLVFCQLEEYLTLVLHLNLSSTVTYPACSSFFWKGSYVFWNTFEILTFAVKFPVHIQAAKVEMMPRNATRGCYVYPNSSLDATHSDNCCGRHLGIVHKQSQVNYNELDLQFKSICSNFIG